jgi:hypothetical protein
MGDTIEPTKVCDHPNVEVRNNFVRLVKSDNGPVEKYVLEISVKCTDCNLPFRFVGDKHLKVGMSVDAPRTTPDFCTLRAPIEPTDKPLQKETIKKLKPLGLILPPTVGKS